MNDIAKEYIAGLSKELQPIAIALHDVLVAIDSEFEVRKAWAGLGFKQGRNYSCNIVEYKDHIKVMIMRGIMLKDDKGNLEGKGVNTRHIKYFTLEDVKEKDLTPYVKEQLKLYADGLTWE